MKYLKYLPALIVGLTIAHVASAQVVTPPTLRKVGNNLLPLSTSTTLGSSTVNGAFNNVTVSVSGKCTGCGATIGTQLRNALAGATLNPYNQLPWTAPPAWASSTFYYWGSVVNDGNGNLYVEDTKLSTSGTAFPFPTTPTTSFVLDGSSTWLLMPLVIPTSTPSSAFITASITSSTSTPTGIGLTKTYSAVTNGAVSPYPFTYGGGIPQVRNGGTTVWVTPATVPTSSAGCFSNTSTPVAQDQCSWHSISFMTDAPKISIGQSDFNAVTPNRLIVNGRFLTYQSLPPFNVFGGLSNPTWETIDLSAIGPGPKEITFESGASGVFTGVYVGPQYSLWPVSSNNKIRATFQGDSSMVGTVNYPVIAGDTFPETLSGMLGWAQYDIAQGGTGYIASNSLYAIPDAHRVNDAVSSSPQVMLFYAGVNDIAHSVGSSTLTNAEVSYFQTMRSLEPNVPFFVLGGYPETSSTQCLAVESSTQAAVNTLNDPLLFYIPVCGDPNGAWVSGTSSVSANNGSGNSGMYVGGDATHLDELGIFYFTSHVYQKIRDIIMNIGQSASTTVIK